MKVFGLDYDGTIINIEPEKAKAFGHLVKKHWGIGEDEAAKAWIKFGGTSRKYKFDYFYNKQFSKQLSDKDYKKIEKEYSQILKNNYYPQTKLLPQALAVLKFIRSHFDYFFVSSGVPMEEINYLARLNGVAKYFDLILGTNDQYRTKRDHLKEVITKKKPQLAIFMADGLSDMRIAKEFNIISIGIPSNHPKEELIKAGATYISDLSGAISLIQKILKQVRA